MCCAFLLRLFLVQILKMRPSSDFFLPSFLSFFPQSPSRSLLHRNRDVIFGILSLVSAPRPRPGCGDWRTPRESRVSICSGGWPSKSQHHPVMCCRRRNIFMGASVLLVLLHETTAPGKTRSLCPQTSASLLLFLQF